MSSEEDEIEEIIKNYKEPGLYDLYQIMSTYDYSLPDSDCESSDDENEEWVMSSKWGLTMKKHFYVLKHRELFIEHLGTDKFYIGKPKWDFDGMTAS